ncbi:PD40 domain-containing protein [Luedemannella flava]|uniref:PD40 domain-containing protein n=1 Tax=Luedemannella flava TaxID=349316 RepID=A0ABP4YEW7_9ACTN
MTDAPSELEPAEPRPMSRRRVVVLALVLTACVAAATAYVIHARNVRLTVERTAPSLATRDDLEAVSAVPHLVFRNTALGDGYGHAAVVALTDVDGPRALTGSACERVYQRSDRTICLSAERKLVTTYRAQLLDRQWRPVRDLPLVGLPSRARLSADGTFVATTTFVSGDSYAQPGQFSTRTVVTPTAGGGGVDLEQFRLIVDGRQVSAADRNVWGVTFADGDTFYATAASSGTTWLVRGSMAARTLTALREDVECPSLSPDGTRIAFKKHGTLPPGKWRLAVLDLATMRETLLGEQRSVDDQAEWLDNGNVLYGMPRTGAVATSDVWVTPADGSGTPRVLVHDAWSPSVVR